VPPAERVSYIYFDKKEDEFPMQLDYFFTDKDNEKMLMETRHPFVPFKSVDGYFLERPTSFKEKRTMPSDHFPIFLKLDLSQHPKK
jgi:hypothetical protein